MALLWENGVRAPPLTAFTAGAAPHPAAERDADPVRKAETAPRALGFDPPYAPPRLAEVLLQPLELKRELGALAVEVAAVVPRCAACSSVLAVGRVVALGVAAGGFVAEDGFGAGEPWARLLRRCMRLKRFLTSL